MGWPSSELGAWSQIDVDMNMGVDMKRGTVMNEGVVITAVSWEAWSQMMMWT